MRKSHLLLLIVIASSFGCEALDRIASGNPEAVQQSIDTIGVIGAVGGPATGGISSLLASLAMIVIPTIIAVNRTIVAHKRAKAISEIEENPGTPAVHVQVKTPSSKKAVRAITG